MSNCHIIITPKIRCTWIVTAGKLLDSVSVRNEIPITDMPPVQRTILYASQVEDIIKYCEDSATILTNVAHTESYNVIDVYLIPYL